MVLGLGLIVSLSGCGQLFGRTAQSRIPDRVRLIRVHIHPGQQRPDQYTSIGNPKSIARIIRTFNRLPLASVLTHDDL